MKLNYIMSHPDYVQISCTDCGAMLAICTIKKTNSSVDAHAVVCAFYALTNTRNVRYSNKEINELNITKANNCDNWIFVIKCRQVKTIMYFTTQV